jgi:exonuclease III
MKLLSWNCRGLGNPRAIRALLRVNRIQNPQVVFLMETRLKSDEMERVRINCGFSSGLFVPCDGFGKERAGGIALMWMDSVNLSIMS